MKIIDIYNDIVDFAGLTVDSDKVYVQAGKNKEPYLVNGKQLVIPTSNMLRKFNAEDNIVFHPMSEDIIKGESPIITKLKYTINIRINIAIGVLVQSLLNLVDSPEYHSGLTPEQSELLYAIKDVDDKTVKNFTSFMMREVNDKEDRLFAYNYLKRAGTVGNSKYARVAILTFPFYQSLVKGEKYKFRTKDIDAYLAIFRFIFPEIDDHEAYNYGSNSDVAPFLDALMMSSYRIADRLNELTNRYKQHIDNYESILFNTNWVDSFGALENLKNEIRSIPTSTTLEAPVQAPVATPQQPMYQPTQQQAPQQMQQVVQYQQPELKETGRGIDFNSLKQKMGMQQMPSAFAQAPMGYNPQMMNRPAPYMGDVMNRPQMMPQQGMPMQQGMYPQQGMPVQGQMMPSQQMMPMQQGMYPQQGMPMQGQMIPMQPGMMMPQQQMVPMQAVPMQPGMYPQQGQAPWR